MATISEALQTALQHHQAGRLELAEEIYRRVLAVEPNQADALHLLGLIVYQAGEREAAVDYIRRAIAARPSSSTYHNSLGVAMKDQGDLAAAASSYRRAIELEPDYPDAYLNLGSVLAAQGTLEEAVACLARAVKLQPDSAAAHQSLGNVLAEQGKFQEAAACYRRAVELKPQSARAHGSLGNALGAQGRLEEAVACYQRAVELEPNLADIHYNLGNAWKDLGNPRDAIASYRRALELKADWAEVHNNLGNAWQELGKPDDALACYREALRLKPDYAEAFTNLGTALKNQGILGEAIASYRRALELKPDDFSAHTNLLYAVHFSPDYDSAAICAEARRWSQKHAEPLRPFIGPHTNDRSADRRLRIGYVSPDFRAHPVGRFLLPLLEAHDHHDFEIFCYASLPVPDAITDRSRAAADAWREVLGLSDAQLADTIRQDRIDILVDLTMHVANTRLLVFARKPAPVQVTYLAYCSTTGLDTIDYRLTDPYLDPPGGDERCYSEQTVRLPETYWCYRPANEIPAVSALPALEAGHVTFGCLNHFCKVTEPTLEAWCRLLAAVPDSRLLVHAYEGSHRDRVRDFFAHRGVSPERLTFIGFTPTAQYFQAYHQMDIALDPFPYGGGTTTCDTLWMGVPVVSLAGATAVGRGGLSILSNVGLPELVARDPEQYVRIAADLAQDLPRLAELRATLRDRMQNSPLMDAPRFARNVEAAYRVMWQRWCTD